jgi:phage gp36-like protein
MPATEAWVTIDVDALRDYFVGAGIDAAMTAALSTGQTDPSDQIINDVVRRIRSEIGSRYTLSATENAIPQDCRWVACMLSVEQLCTRVPGLATLIDDNARVVIRDAHRYLERIAAGEIAIPMPEDPLEPSALQTQSNATVVSSITRKFTRDTLAGL